MNRRGTALLVALLTLMLAGAIASAALATGQVRWRSGLAQEAAARASLEMQSALDHYSVGWEHHRFDTLTAGAGQELGRVQGFDLRRHDSIFRLGPSLFQVRSAVEVGATGVTPLARDAAGLLIQLTPLHLIDTAVVVAPEVLQLDAARIDGNDHVPPGWAARCSTAGPAVPAHLADSAPFAHFLHDPRLLLHPRSGADSVTVLQGANRVVDGMGSGILWARGSLALSGNFHFAGVMLVEGSLRMSDHARVDGVVVATSLVHLAGMAEIKHSSCAIRFSLAANPVVPRPVRGGWWRLD